MAIEGSLDPIRKVETRFTVLLGTPNVPGEKAILSLIL